MSQEFDCPKPSKYDGRVLSNRAVWDDLVDSTNENHDQISNQLELVLGGPDALAQFNQPEIALAFERSQFILECGLVIFRNDGSCSNETPCNLSNCELDYWPCEHV
ncbi:hypothetical protein RCL1_007662 [Eukaryota sp. TZLM3-RCL]